MLHRLHAHPVMLELTDGTTSPPPPNKPISGKFGSLSVNKEDTIIFLRENTIVDNSFAAPGAEGCGLLPAIIDPIIDVQAGLPSAAGHNSAELTNTLELAGVGEIRPLK
jgi:hypothetical protein